MEAWSKRKDRRKQIRIPMFSGYLFVELFSLDNDVKLRVLTTPGVVRLLGNPRGHEPIPVPDEKITAIRRLIESSVEIHPYLYPQTGDPARIVDGPFKDIKGIVLRSDLKKDFFVVSIDLLQRSVAIELKGFQIERI
jgi:transcription antitermination factor NusG